MADVLHRVPVREQDAKVRATNFEEVCLGYNMEEAVAEAARCLGLNARQTMSKIVIPQAVKNILPAMGNELVMMLKETSLASTFFIGEIMTQCNVIGGATFLQIETLIISGIMYLILTSAVSKLVGIYERRLAVSD